MNELLMEIEKETGFVSYENASMAKPQYAFYGTSDKFNDFKTMIAGKVGTGTIAYLIDTGESHMYSAYKDTWY